MTDDEPGLPGALRDYRKARRVSQATLAARAALSTGAIKAYEGGTRRPSAKALKRIAEALGLPRDEAIRVLHVAGFTLSSQWQFEPRAHADIIRDLEREAAACAWPIFVTNQSYDVLLANRAFERLVGVDLRREFLGFGERNLVVHSLTKRFASQIDNWAEVITFMIGLAKGDARWLDGDIAHPAPWLKDLTDRLSEGDPQLLVQLLSLWDSAPPIQHRLRHRYAVRWLHKGKRLIAFDAVMCMADLASELHWNEWIPADAESWAILEEVKARAKRSA